MTTTDPLGAAGTILVAGGAGFIGSAFVRLLAARGYRPVVLDALTYAGHRENLLGIEGVELVVGNICDAGLLAALFEKHRPDALVNFAAESHVDRSIAGPAAFIETNIRGVFELLNASLVYWKALPELARARYRHVQISTDEVFGALGDEGRFSERSPIAPNSPYSASKAAGDQLVRAWHHTYGLPTITTHCSNNYGPRQHPEKLIPYALTEALAGRPIPVYGSGRQVRDWLHVEDHCEGLLLALARGRPGAVFCLGGRAERRNLDVVTALCATLDRLAPRADERPYAEQIAFVTDRPGHDWRYAIDDAFARRELGFTTRDRFEDGLAQTVRWYLENEAWRLAVAAR